MFTNKIRERRKELGLSQTRLANLIGMAEPTLSNIELGKWKPWPKAKRDIARTLGVEEKELFPNENI